MYIGKKKYVYKEPDVLLKCASVERYSRAYEKAVKRGLVKNDDMLPILLESGIWDKEQEAALVKVEKDIETFKIEIFKNRAKKRDLEYLRRNITEARKQRDELSAIKNRHYLNTVEGYASSDKMRFLVGSSLYKVDGTTRVWPGSLFWKDRSNLLEQVISKYLNARPSQSQIRELSRTEPWRSIWACRESVQNIFSVPAASLSDDQRTLVVWTRIYDNAREDQDGPGEEAIDDDDMFDGWMALRRDKADKDRKGNKRLEALTSDERILNADTVMISMGDNMSDEEIDEIYDMNDEGAKHNISRRFRALDRKGEISEFEMPDTKENLKMKKNQAVGGG